MTPKRLFNRLVKNSTVWVFLFCLIIVFFTQFTLLQPSLQYGLFRPADDWDGLISYKSLSDLPLFTKFSYILQDWGLHRSGHIFWMGLLNYFFNTDYAAFQVTNVLTKTLSVVFLFPAILIIFKSRLLAFLTTILYGINSGATGSLLWVQNGNHYAAIVFMNIFFVFYYYTITKNSKLLLFFTSVIFFITYFLAPDRMFFLIPFIPLIELFNLLRKGFFRNLLYSILRTAVILTPVMIFAFQISISTPDPMTKIPYTLFDNILNGNWHLLLYPLAGVGNSILTNDYWKFLGNLSENTLHSFGNYLIFIVTGPLVTFTILTIILSKVLSKTPKRFFLLVFGLNLFFEIVMFFISTHHFHIAQNLIADYKPFIFLVSKYPTLLAFYIFTVATGCFLEWKKDQGNLLLLACWLGPLFSILYTFSIWLLTGSAFASYSSINHLSYYLIISPIGTALFLAAILTLAFKRTQNRNVILPFVLAIILGVVFILYSTYGQEIKREFMVNDPISQPTVKIQAQENILNTLISKLGYAAKNGNLLVYFEFPDSLSRFYYQRALASSDFVGTYFGEAILARRNNTTTGCASAIFDRDKLKITESNGIFGFMYQGACLDATKQLYQRQADIFYNLDDFYAFKFDQEEFVDIKTDILKQLQKNYIKN